MSQKKSTKLDKFVPQYIYVYDHHIPLTKEEIKKLEEEKKKKDKETEYQSIIIDIF